MSTLPSPRALLRRVYPAAARTLGRFPRRFGAFEVFLHTRVGSIEWLARHLRILNELERIRAAQHRSSLRVIDFGGSNGSLARALGFYGLIPHYELVLCDIDRVAVDAAPLTPPLVEKHVIDPDGKLPFDDDAFDVGVSSDVFEHIPKDARARWARELRRVSRFAQIHTIPCDSDDGLHDSSGADRSFAGWYEQTFGEKERWTIEHIEQGVPTHLDLENIFERARLTSFANTGVWGEIIRAQFKEYSRVKRAARAIRFIGQREADSRPPFKACLVVMEHTSS